MIPADTTIYATDATPDGIAAARAWIKLHGLTADDCRLVKREDMCLVIAKRDGLNLQVSGPRGAA